MAAPTITPVAPAVGPLAGGTAVVITGTHFNDSGVMSAVHFGATAATSFVVNSNTQVTAIAPAEAGGTVDIDVTTPGGTSAHSGADLFTFRPTILAQRPGPPGSFLPTQASAPSRATF